MRINSGLECTMDGEELTIRIGINRLASGVQYENGDIDVCDVAAFAKSMLRAITNESEDGHTLVHAMMQQAAEYCVDQGLEGIDLNEDDDEY